MGSGGAGGYVLRRSHRVFFRIDPVVEPRVFVPTPFNLCWAVLGIAEVAVVHSLIAKIW